LLFEMTRGPPRSKAADANIVSIVFVVIPENLACWYEEMMSATFTIPSHPMRMIATSRFSGGVHGRYTCDRTFSRGRHVMRQLRAAHRKSGGRAGRREPRKRQFVTIRSD